jgi:hypothetical protein
MWGTNSRHASITSSSSEWVRLKGLQEAQGPQQGELEATAKHRIGQSCMFD